MKGQKGLPDTIVQHRAQERKNLNKVRKNVYYSEYRKK